MNDQRLSVVSEIHELEELLGAIPEENVIERMSLEARLQASRQLLDKLPQESEAPKARLTFRGKPVLGRRGITADFGARAAGAFSDAFTTIAAGLTEGLQAMGPIPNRDRNQLLLTGTAIGSFGFEFELPVCQGTLFPAEENAREAMLKIEELFRLSAEGSDDDIAEVIAEIHPRAVKKVFEFLDLLVQQQAWCGLEFGSRSFHYENYEQLRQSSFRLRAENIREREENYRGKFQGILPAGRTFEFQLRDHEGLIRGKIDETAGDPDILNRQWLYTPAILTLKVMQVGEGQPRFTLMSLDDIAHDDLVAL